MSVESCLKDGFGEYFDVEPNTGCWLWIRAHDDARGYGYIYADGKVCRAHRVMWEVFNQETIPDGLVVMHSCDQPACVNPDHLSVGSQRENITDAVKRRRLSCLKEHEVFEIMRRRNGGELRRKIAEDFGVSEKTVYAIASGTRWSWLTGQGDESNE